VQNIEPKKFGGWLILIGIGIVISPLRIIQLLTFTHVPIFTDGTWEVLTTVGSEAYSPLWGPILSIEITINILLLASSIYLIYLFFKKKKIFWSLIACIIWVPYMFISERAKETFIK
jgi:hypothetical protein